MFFIFNCCTLKKEKLGESNKLSTKTLTFSNNKGETISYIPDLEKEKSFSVHFNNIVNQVKTKFGIEDSSNIKFTYNPFNNPNSINATKIIGNNDVLTKDNLSQFWNLLKTHKTVSVMNFIIGDIIGKKATIICVESLQNNSASMILFKNDKGSDDIDDYDWDKVFSLQFIPFIKQAIATREDNNKHDDDDIDYDELGFKIYKIDAENEEDVFKTCNLINFSKMREKYDLEEEVEDGDILQDYYARKESGHCYFFVENKACLVISAAADEDNDKELLLTKPYYWKTKNIEEVDIDWENELLSMKKTLCNNFGITNNKNVKLVFEDDNGVEIRTGDDLEVMWHEIYYDDDEIYLKLIIIDPYTKFIINCQKANESGIESSISLSLDLDLSGSDGNQAFKQFCESFGVKAGLGGSWQSKFKLLDFGSGEFAENASQFLKICQSYNNKNIRPINFRLEPKVHPFIYYNFFFYLWF